MYIFVHETRELSEGIIIGKLLPLIPNLYRLCC